MPVTGFVERAGMEDYHEFGTAVECNYRQIIR